MFEVKYPNIKVKLSGQNGNAFVLLGAVDRALRKGGVHQTERHEFLEEAKSGDYDHLVQTCMKWVDVS